jgi:hypothetical protein
LKKHSVPFEEHLERETINFFLYGFYNKKFIKDIGLVEIDSKILPKVIRTWVEEYSIEKSVWREYLGFC